MISTCPQCGRELSVHNRHVRFALPDPLVGARVDIGADGLWMSHETPRDSVFLQADSVGAFLRALAPIQLSGGYTVTYGVWVGVHPGDMRRAFDVWWMPSYRDLEIEGRLANNLPGWDVLGAPVHLAVRNTDETPYCVTSTNDAMSAVLADVWPHEAVLASLPE